MPNNPIPIILIFLLIKKRSGAAGRKKQNRINLSNWLCLCCLYFVQLRIAKVNPILLLSTCSTSSRTTTFRSHTHESRRNQRILASLSHLERYILGSLTRKVNVQAFT